jgi:hypothetical protein
MGKEIRTEIKDNYTFYNTLLKERKSIFTQVISISKLGNNANIMETSSDVVHSNSNTEINLIIDVKTNNHNFFQFKLRCTDLSQIPFFRYDSDGDTHRNYDDDIPLSQQQITTPHFHYFNDKGINIAYKTPQLLNEVEMNALQDINLCIKHFCHESNLRFNEEDFPDIQILPDALNLKTTKDDPSSTVNFI